MSLEVVDGHGEADHDGKLQLLELWCYGWTAVHSTIWLFDDIPTENDIHSLSW